jgi:oligopeptide transport system substrate-binding protein
MKVGSVLAAALLLLLAGCSVGGDKTAAGNSAETSDEQVLRWGIVGEENLDDIPWEVLTDLPIETPWNLFDPLVKVDDDLEAVPHVAERWEWSDDGRTLTFYLRLDGRWTNDDPLTAHDYVYGWHHTLLELQGEREGSGIFSSIVGADDYAACDPKKRHDCEDLWDAVGVRAVDDYTLEVELAEPQPWFPELVGGYSCVCFGALHRPTVERFGDDWAEPEHIVTSGPFKLAEWEHGTSLVLVKNEDWWDADRVLLDRVEIRLFRTHEQAARALRSGAIDVTDAQVDSKEHRAVYPYLSTWFVGLRVDDVPDPRQRRAMALALDRRTIVEKQPAAGARPATSLTTDGIPGFGRLTPGFLHAEARLDSARQLLAAVPEPRLNLKLWTHDVPQWRALAAEVRSAWRRLGIESTVRSLPSDELIDLLEKGELDDAFLMGWGYDAPDPANLLDVVFRCGSIWNFTGYCDPAFDQVLDRAAREPDPSERLDLYAQAEAMLTGADGAMPAIPLSWGSRSMLERPHVRETFELNHAAQVDLTKVRVAGG